MLGALTWTVENLDSVRVEDHSLESCYCSRRGIGGEKMGGEMLVGDDSCDLLNLFLRMVGWSWPLVINGVI